MKSHGPDGRVWEVARRPDPQRPLAALLPGTTWLVEARTDDETRLWRAGSRAEASKLVATVAMALRTGGPSPTGELSANDLGGGADPAAPAERVAPTGEASTQEAAADGVAADEMPVPDEAPTPEDLVDDEADET
ncbi:hypothetical protein [Egicoccus sp. AB-alg2]|uniref:hypothetical protein n=1 Tax=Egicoccus sp. AB-alg2 TaxID=3242693 RepID=UPI00359D9059